MSAYDRWCKIERKQEVERPAKGKLLEQLT